MTPGTGILAIIPSSTIRLRPRIIVAAPSATPRATGGTRLRQPQAAAPAAPTGRGPPSSLRAARIAGSSGSSLRIRRVASSRSSAIASGCSVTGASGSGARRAAPRAAPRRGRRARAARRASPARRSRPPSSDEDQVGVADRREAVGDHERRAAVHQPRRARRGSPPRSSSRSTRSARRGSGSARPCRNARATEMRWRSPPDSIAPRSPSSVVVALRQRADEVVRVGRRARPRSISSSLASSRP